jgi:hypothetical protein
MSSGPPAATTKTAPKQRKPPSAAPTPAALRPMQLIRITPNVRIPLGNQLFHAPAGAVLLWLRRLCLEDRHYPVDEIETTVFAFLASCSAAQGAIPYLTTSLRADCAMSGRLGMCSRRMGATSD